MNTSPKSSVYMLSIFKNSGSMKSFTYISAKKAHNEFNKWSRYASESTHFSAVRLSGGKGLISEWSDKNPCRTWRVRDRVRINLTLINTRTG